MKSEPANYDILKFDHNINEIDGNYDDMLNFSSEIEFDDRFEAD